jgi:ATP-dependent DNA ligase
MRINQGQELVIGGYTPSDRSFDALITGYYENNRLLYAGRTRNGFTPMLRLELMKRLRPLEDVQCPFANLPERKKRMLGTGLNRRQDEGLPLVKTAAGRTIRICRMDGGLTP